MNFVDLIIAAFALAFAAIGYERGLIASGLPLAGFVLGAAIGGRLGPALLVGGGESPYAPLITVVNELKHVEHFELDQVRRHPSRLAELENLSSAIADMAGGLAAFRKYIPADLVKMLVSEGVEPRPGGSIRCSAGACPTS